MSAAKLTWSKLRVLRSLLAVHPEPGTRPPKMHLRTMDALEHEGLIRRHDFTTWSLTAKGLDLASQEAP